MIDTHEDYSLCKPYDTAPETVKRELFEFEKAGICPKCGMKRRVYIWHLENGLLTRQICLECGLKGMIQYGEKYDESKPFGKLLGESLGPIVKNWILEEDET